MAKGVQAALAVQLVVLGFDPDPTVAPARALHVVTLGGALPSADVDARETVAAAGQRLLAAIGTGADVRGRRRTATPILVGLGDEPGARARTLVVRYLATAAYGELSGAGAGWSAVGRGLRLGADDQAAVRSAVERLRSDAHSVAGAAGLLGDVFTGDDLLRVLTALHGAPESSERTFRRRVQELRDAGVLRPVRDVEVAALRERFARFRSPAGTGGRPPELLRYSGNGGERESLTTLRARRTA